MARSHSLIFTWRKPPGTLAILGSFLILSTLIHALGFYIFHVVYQPAVSLPPTAARLTIIHPESPLAAPFLAWLESEDPALTSVPDPVSPDLGTLAPVYETGISGFRTESITPVEPPSLSRHGLPMAVARLIPKPIAQLGSAVSSSTAPRADRPIQSFARFDRLQPDNLVPSGVLGIQPGESAVTPAEFLLGIDRRGSAAFIIPERGAGSDELDARMIRRLRELRFPADPARAEILWQKAAVSWQLE